MEVGDVVCTFMDGEMKSGKIKRIYSTFHADVRFFIGNKGYRVIKLNLSDLKKIELSKL